MPPCPPHTAETTIDAETELTAPMKSVPMGVTPSKSTMPLFAWENNLICIASLVGVYASLPSTHAIYFYGFLGIALLDMIVYYKNKGSMAGIPYTLPFVSLLSMLWNPVRFWKEQADIAMESKDGLSTNTLVGKFMVFVTDVKLCREVMTRESDFGIYAHPNAKWLFGANNLIYMDTEPHKEFRALLTPALFSNESLTMYARFHERVCRSYLERIAEKCRTSGKAVDVRVELRSMAAAASQESFLGPYLDDHLRKVLEEDILSFTLGFLCFPCPFAGGLKKALDSKRRIQAELLKMTPKARQYIAEGNEPRCLLEYWALAISDAAKQKGVDPAHYPGCSDMDVAITVLDFLFAAQDATNSALAFTVDVLATRPDVLRKIREEMATYKGEEIWSMIRDTEKMEYTCHAARQMLHHKPPVPMIPHMTKRATSLAGHRLPKGSVIIPSIAFSARTSGSSLQYDPERENPDSQFVKTPIFGGGQHKCPGRRYAETLLTVFFAVFVENYTFERVGPRPALDEIMYYPTLFPCRNMFMVYALEKDGD